MSEIFTGFDRGFTFLQTQCKCDCVLNASIRNELWLVCPIADVINFNILGAYLRRGRCLIHHQFLPGCVKWFSNHIVITTFISWHSITRKSMSFFLFIYLFRYRLVYSYFIQWIVIKVIQSIHVITYFYTEIIPDLVSGSFFKRMSVYLWGFPVILWTTLYFLGQEAVPGHHIFPVLVLK